MSDENRIVTLTNEITQILTLMVTLEDIQDSRSYSTLDIIEALDLTQVVVAERVADGYNDWRNDAEKRYENFFASVKDQCRITITNCFTLPDRKAPRFVDTFNLLILERLFDMLSELGPDASGAMVAPLIDMFKIHLEQVDLVDPLSAMEVQKQLAAFRKQTLAPKVLSQNQRLDFIRIFVEKVQEQLT